MDGWTNGRMDESSLSDGRSGKDIIIFKGGLQLALALATLFKTAKLDFPLKRVEQHEEEGKPDPDFKKEPNMNRWIWDRLKFEYLVELDNRQSDNGPKMLKTIRKMQKLGMGKVVWLYGCNAVWLCSCVWGHCIKTDPTY